MTPQKITSTLDAVVDWSPQAHPAHLAPLSSQPASRVAEFLASESLTGAQGHDVALVERGSNRPLAFATVLRAESSAFQGRTRLAPSTLEKAAFLTRVHVAPDAPKGTLAVLLYAALRQARSWGRTMGAFLMVDDDTPLSRQYGLVSLAGASHRRARRSGLPRQVPAPGPAAAARLRGSSRRGQPLLPSFLVSEVLDTIHHLFLDKVGQAAFFQAVDAGTLTREQYVYALTQMHLFVRYTTRVLGRCVGHSPTTELRTHFIAHLKGEVNHEIIIERDLAHLGEDVAYVKELAQPNLPTREFMCTQESAIAFYEIPILLLAAPLTAEGVSGHLGQLFMDKLNACVASWGVKEPQKATYFLGSHIEFDSGDDGHWQGNLDLLAQHLRTEPELRRFLSLLRVCVDATLRQWDSYVSDVDLFSAQPPHA